MVLFALGLIVGIQVGWYSEWLKKQVQMIQTRLKSESQSGVTLGLYGRPNPSRSSSVVMPKTPQEMQRQADEEIQKGLYS